jgi:hypothetical protein
MTTTIDLTALNKKLDILGLTYVEWDDCTEQYILTINRSDFPFKKLIQENLKEFGLYMDDFINGHGYVRPLSTQRMLDNRLKEWHYTLVTG